MGQARISVQVLAPARPRARARRARPSTAAPRALVPLGVGAILDTAVGVLVRRFGLLVGVSAALVLPVRIFEAAVVQSLSPTLGLDPNLFLAPALGVGVQFLISQFAAAVVAEDLVRGDVDAGRALAATFGRPLGVVLLPMAATAVTVAALCMCVLPVVSALWLCSVAPAVYVLERRGPLESLRRSASLTVNAFPRWLGWFTVSFAAMLPMSLSLDQLADPSVRDFVFEHVAVGPLAYDVVGALVASLFLGLDAALSGAIAAVYYLDLCVRREGLDLELALAALEGRTAEDGEPA